MNKQVIITLKKTIQGFEVINEPEKTDMTVRIPKFIVGSGQNKIIMPNQSSQQQPPQSIQQKQYLMIQSPSQQFPMAMQQIPQLVTRPSQQKIQYQPPLSPQQIMITPTPPQAPIETPCEISGPDQLIFQNDFLLPSIPEYAAWFKIENIHIIEKECFPEFFKSKKVKTPSLYKHYRNLIIKLYYRSPNNYLSPTSCRKQIVADSISIIRIHGFLNHWGIINSQINNLSNRLIPQPAIQEKESKNNDQSINNLLKQAYQLRPYCDSCQSKCNLVWYQQKPVKDVKEIILCLKCFGNNDFPEILSVNDFFKTDIETKLKNLDFNQNIDQNNDFASIFEFINQHPENSYEEIIDNLKNEKFSDSETWYNMLAFPLQDGNQRIRILEDQETLKNLNIRDLAKRIAEQKPSYFSDSSSLVIYHVDFLKKQLFKTNMINGHQEPQLNEIEKIKLSQLHQNSLQRANILAQDEEKQLNSSINELIFNKTEIILTKLAFIEEYEKIVQFSKIILDNQQKQSIAEKLLTLQQKLQFYQEETNQ